MKTITATEANRNFARILDEARKGETFVVTSHGKAVAKVVPVERERTALEYAEAKKRLFDRLARQPVLNLGRITRDEIYDRE